MPFPDEDTRVVLTPYRSSWAVEFDALAGRIADALGSIALSIDHIGSTAIPGMPAKDVIDFQVSREGAGPGSLRRVLMQAATAWARSHRK